jgi:HAD superfamily hydrolase (TIGR01509 family)
MKKNIKLVLFDLDGLLIQSWPFIMASYNHVLSNLKLPREGLLDPIMRHCTLEQSYNHLGITGDKTAIATQLHLEFQSSNMHLIQPFPDAHSTLEALGSRFHKGVVSNRSKNAPTILMHCNLFQHIELIIGADDVSRGKPHPEGIFYAMQHFWVEPFQTVIIGDTVADVEAGKRIGAWTVAVDGSDCLDALRAAKPDYLLKNLGQLVPLLL